MILKNQSKPLKIDEINKILKKLIKEIQIFSKPDNLGTSLGNTNLNYTRKKIKKKYENEFKFILNC